MRITALQVEGARNLARVQLTPGPRFNVFFGDNGQGKTNLIETVYVLATLRSFRTARLAELVALGGTKARLSARVVRADTERRYDVILEPPRRTALVDGKPVRPLARYFGGWNVVLFAPEDLLVARGAPSERRRFLDRAVFARSPSYLPLAQELDKVLRSRNAVLRQIADGDGRARVMLPIYDAQLAPLAVKVSAARRALVAELAPRFAAGFEAITRTGLGVAARLETAAELAGGDEGAVLAALQRDHARDVARGSTSFGPHRDDLLFELDGHPAAQFASQGQLRALVLAWKIAELDLLREVHGEAPILLLDDVSSELDDERNLHLFEYLTTHEHQCFITTTHPRHVILTRDRVDHVVRGGVISPVDPPG
ncbi:MAG TPA: DNA replication/repair protein RecF [Kofleriaceae bacterium]|nr:DNA replication/repair protein RecF [Kofleriaceae bacterium]